MAGRLVREGKSSARDGITKTRYRKITAKPIAPIIYDPDDNGHSDIMAIQMGKNGWLTDPDGDKHRCKLLEPRSSSTISKTTTGATNAAWSSDPKGL